MGEVCRRSVDAITDSQSSGVREEKKIHVQSFVLFDQKFRQASPFFPSCICTPQIAS